MAVEAETDWVTVQRRKQRRQKERDERIAK